MTSPIRGLRDLFFLVAGSVIAYHEFWLEEDPSPIGAFMVLFLWGLIPAFRAEDANVPSPLQVLMALLAGKGLKESPAGRGEDREARVAREAQVVREAEQEARADRAAEVARQQQKRSRQGSNELD